MYVYTNGLVVAGIMYHLDLDVNTRISPRNMKYWSCEAKMLEVPWLNTLELVEFHCRKRSSNIQMISDYAV
ncbi:hypothetical protein MAR_011638 [Mya arenaria]|uniref:Uncharacterized protein n=1 Tax=Mya arenaria TaxID=6604 RepID=A0ABY7FXC3_MYAAR|nr:hypothetical protein MAR_011638 [Mya arenaria]